jgi:hypothetical protein
VTEFAWLIEAPGQYYLEANAGYFGWTNDANKALRFYSSAQANKFLEAFMRVKPDLFAFAKLLSDARAVEHGWTQAGD